MSVFVPRRPASDELDVFDDSGSSFSLFRSSEGHVFGVDSGNAVSLQRGEGVNLICERIWESKTYNGFRTDAGLERVALRVNKSSASRINYKNK